MDINEHAHANEHIYEFAKGYLERRGWFESLNGIPQNKDGLVPWITYPAFIPALADHPARLQGVRVWLRRLLHLVVHPGGGDHQRRARQGLG